MTVQSWSRRSWNWSPKPEIARANPGSADRDPGGADWFTFPSVHLRLVLNTHPATREQGAAQLRILFTRMAAALR